MHEPPGHAVGIITGAEVEAEAIAANALKLKHEIKTPKDKAVIFTNNLLTNNIKIAPSINSQKEYYNPNCCYKLKTKKI